MKQLVAVLLPTIIVTTHAFALDYHPIIVTSTEGQVDLQTRRTLVESFSKAIGRGIHVGLAQEFYGRGDRFEAERAKGPLSIWNKIQVSIDKYAERAIQRHRGQIRPSSGEKATATIQLFWTQRSFSGATFAFGKTTFGSLIGLAMNAPQMQTGQPLFANLGQTALRTELIDASRVDGGVSSLYREAKGAFEALQEAFPRRWLPLHLKADVGVNRQGNVWSELTFDLIPVGFNKGASPVDDEAEFAIEKMVFLPRDSEPAPFGDVQLRASEYTVVQIRIRRSYDGRASAPEVLVRFGHLGANLEMMLNCVSDHCLQYRDNIPTIYIKLLGSKFKRFFANLLSLEEFRFAISSLAIDMNTLKVISKGSEIVVMVRTADGGRKAISIRDQGISPSLTSIQRLLVSDQLRAGIVGEIQTSVESANVSLAKKLNEYAGAITGLFR